MTEKEVIAQTIVDIIGGTTYDGAPTDIYNYIQRLRILVEREEKMKCCANCQFLKVSPHDFYCSNPDRGSTHTSYNGMCEYWRIKE